MIAQDSRLARAQSGFVLVAVLWMLALLAGLATIYSAYARASAASATLPIERLRAEAAIRSAVELTVYNLLSQPAEKRVSHGSFEFPLGPVRVAVAFQPEAARIDLNAAAPELLAALFQALGLKSEAAAAAAAQVVAWRQPASTTTKAADDKLYRGAGLAYDARHGPFEDALELALIPGLSPELVERALPHVTVYTGAQVDVADADDIVRAALAASGQAAPAAAAPVAPGAAQADPGAPAPAGQVAPADLAGAAPAAAPQGAPGANAAQNPQVFRLSILVATSHRRSLHANVVFSLQDQGDEPYWVLFWRDDFDAPLGAV